MIAGLVGEDHTDWLPGEVHDASEWYARYLIHRGAAVAVDALPPAPALTTQAVEAPQPVVQHRDPVRRRK